MKVIFCVVGDEVKSDLADVGGNVRQLKEMSVQFPTNDWTVGSFDESKVPEVIKAIRVKREKLIKEKKLAELTRKFQFGKFGMSRLTENEIYERVRKYLACFYINDLVNVKERSKISEEIWLRNEGLPVGEGLFELYKWFCRERGYENEVVIEDLDKLAKRIIRERYNEFRIENEWRRKEREERMKK